MVSDAHPLSPPQGEPTLLIEAVGPPFLAFDHLSRNLKTINGISFSFGVSILSSANRIRAVGSGILVAHISTEGEILQLSQFLHDLGDLIGNQKVGIIAVSRIYTHKLKEMLVRNPLVSVFLTSIDGPKLQTEVAEFIEIIAERAPKKKILTTPESNRDGSLPVVATNLFVPIKEKPETDKIYEECCTRQAVVTLSSEDLNDRINVVFLKFDKDTRRIWGRGDEIKSFIEGIKKRTISDEIHLLFSFGLNRSRIFFKSTGHFEVTAANLFELILPPVVFEVQRRTQIRLNCFPAEEVSIQFQFANQKARFSAAMYDLASGGLSFIITSDKVAKFKNGTHLQHIKFQLGDRNLFVAEAVVCHVSPLPGEGGDRYRVGLHFKIVLARDTAYLGMYVFKRNLDYITKLVG